MGVAIVFGPLILLFMLAPILYVVFAILVGIYLCKGTKNRERLFSILLVLVLSGFYPVKAAYEYYSFSSLCEMPRKPITTEPIEGVESIVFATEGKRAFVWEREMKLNLETYETAYLVNGEESGGRRCNWSTHKCENVSDLASRYMFLVSTERRDDTNIVASSISVVDRWNNQILYETTEYVYSSLLASYHGSFLAKIDHGGQLSCGYLDGGIDAWRPNDSYNKSRLRYAETDTAILTSIFPTLVVK